MKESAGNTTTCSGDPLSASVSERVAGLLDLAGHHWQRDFPSPTITLGELGMTAGRASHACWTITLNATLLRENPEDMLRQTVGHEVAHLVAFAVYGPGIKPHGAQWRQVMAVFGLEARRCHEYDVDNARRRRTRQYLYVCPGCGETFPLGPVRHGRQMREESRYCCRHCRTVIEYTGKYSLS